MVNVPPIPPLLCSTPPPIDFGEEDEDVDVMPPTLNGVDNEDYDDFLTVDDDSKNDEPLPSPRLPSASDLPTDNFYDDQLPPDEEVTNNITTPPLKDDKQSETNSKNCNTNSINIAEAFNYNITNANEEANNKINDNNKDTSQEATILSASESNEEEQSESENIKLNQKAFEIESTSFETTIDNIDLEEMKNTPKNLKELKIETSVESTNKSDKPKLSSMQNMVSIEDIEDDLSDDELYSPKTPKNFKETDNLNDYFKIQEIKPEKNVNKSQDLSKEIDTKSIDSESASGGNQKEFKSFSFANFPQPPSFDLPPPLDDPPTSLDVDDDDDFGDFADFQDFNSAISPEIQTNKDPVPANDINQLNDEEFNDFSNHNLQENSTDDTKIEINKIITQDLNGFKQEEFTFKNENFQHFNPNSTEKGLMENSEFEEYSIKDRTNKYKSMENLSVSFGDFNGSTTETKVSNGSEDGKDSTVRKEYTLSHNNSSEDLRQDAKFNKNKNDESSKLEVNTFGEFTQTTEKQQEQQTERSDCKEITETHENDDDDEFNDFADFEQHQEIPQIDSQQFTEFKEAEKPATLSKDDTDDDDDDFGDFNTAQPVNPTLTQKSSLNITTTTAPMLTPKNLNERISKILQLMFPPSILNNEVNTAEPNAHKIQDIPFTSIDAAKALEYQWLISDTRHSFIKSLAIDSRNILFGENWNPSLPRFAANLSFNPLKPMRPVSLSGNMSDSVLEPVAINTIESMKPLSMELSNSVQKENNDLDWKSSNTTEQTKEAFKDNSITLEVIATATTSVSNISNGKTQEPESLTIFENPLDNEDKFSNTPPISEMESVNTFPSALPTTTPDMELTSSHIINNLNDLAGKEVEENLKNTLNINEVVVTSTFTGSFKETHIYTPSKTSDFETKQTSSSSPSKSIDFDFEKAAMGVIIDETVVKKEYRDVEYNPSFLMGSSLNNKSSITNKVELFESNNKNELNSNANNNTRINDIKMSVGTALEEDECNDDFTEFQSVPSEAYSKPKQSFNNTAEVVKPPAAVSHGGMILSPAILIPQAIFMENNKPKPKIEWGDSTANINAEEMARIDELFPEPKSIKSSNTSSSSQKSTPTHQIASTPSISATVHNKELGGGCGGNNDDDDWSEFVSVSITTNTSANRTVANNNILTKTPGGSPFKQRSPVVPHRMPMTHSNNSNNDDEWSDFVSSAPQPAVQQPSSYRVPQFNSGAWQNANFYNNPLGMYHKGPINLTSTGQHSPKHFYNNNNNNNSYNNIHHQQYQQQTANKIPPGIGQQQHNYHHQHQQHQLTPQQIHIMQNFSTAPVPIPSERLNVANSTKNNQFQVGSAKVAPSIALIPDLGFVAPAIPTHTSFINSLPKPSINTKK